MISALNRTDFPVPRARVLCTDESVIGTMFYKALLAGFADYIARR